MRVAGTTLVVGRRALRTTQWPSALGLSLRRTCTTSGPHTAAAARASREMGEASTARVLRPFSGGRRKLRGVVFDMDGTLTEPYLDFAEMRRRVGVTDGDLLDVMGTWSEERQVQANAVIAEMETEARDNMTLMPGVHELLAALDAWGLPRGILTRNVTTSVDWLHNMHLRAAPFAPAVTREFRPYKPHPAGLLHICATWSVHPSEVLMIGDSAKDDVVVGNRAGSATILLDTTARYADLSTLVDEARPHFVVSQLRDVEAIITEHFEVAARAAAV